MSSPSQNQISLREYIRILRVGLRPIFWADELKHSLGIKESYNDVSQYLLVSDIEDSNDEVEEARDSLFDDILYTKSKIKEKYSEAYYFYEALTKLHSDILLALRIKEYGVDIYINGEYIGDATKEYRIIEIVKIIKMDYMRIQMKYMKDAENHPLIDYMEHIISKIQGDQINETI